MSSRASAYKPLNTQEPNDVENSNAKKARAQMVDRIQAKIHALFWLCASVGTCYYVDFFDVAINNEDVRRTVLNLGVVFFACMLCLVGYLGIYLPVFKNIKDQKMWEIYCPNVIPTITFLGVGTIVLFHVAFWPVWGLLTPLIMFIFSLGLLLCGHFLPSLG